MNVEILIPFDLETTGVDVETARIVQAYVGTMLADGTVTGQTWLLDPGVEIPADATAIHGITTEHARNEGQNAADALIEIEGVLAAAQIVGHPIAGMNLAYDLTLLDREIRRHFGRPLSFEPRPVLDILVLDKAIDTYRKGSRTLTALADHYGVLLGDDAHGAAADAIAAARIALKLIALPDPTLPIRDDVRTKWATVTAGTIHDVHRWQIKWRERQQTSLGDYFASTPGKEHLADTVRIDWPIVPAPLAGDTDE